MEHLLTFMPQEVLDNCNLFAKNPQVEPKNTPIKKTKEQALASEVDQDSQESSEESKTETVNVSSEESLPPLAKSKSLFTEMSNNYSSGLLQGISKQEIKTFE